MTEIYDCSLRKKNLITSFSVQENYSTFDKRNINLLCDPLTSFCELFINFSKFLFKSYQDYVNYAIPSKNDVYS